MWKGLFKGTTRDSHCAPTFNSASFAHSHAPLLPQSVRLFPRGDAVLHHAEGAACRDAVEGFRRLEQEPDPACLFRLNRQCIACITCIAVAHQHFNGKSKVELKPPAPDEIMVSREKARAFIEWMDGAG
jgi:hypothetical protein